MRNIKNKPEKIECKLCFGNFSLYGLPSHIKYIHGVNVDDYVKRFGEFRKNRIPKKKIRKTNKVNCRLCNKQFSTVGMHVHLRDTHSITVDEYKKKYGEYRPKYIDYQERARKNKIKCLVCRDKFGSERLLTFHIKLVHKLSKSDYVDKFVFSERRPLCKCGCGCEVKTKNQPPYRFDFLDGHNGKGKNNGMFNRVHKLSSLHKMSERAIKRIGKTNKFDTVGEINFKKFLEKLGVQYIHQYRTEFGVVDFYLPKYDLFVEIDGSYWHRDDKINLNFQQIANLNSEFKKGKIKNLVRINDTDLDRIKNIDDLYQFSRILNFELEYTQKVLTKEYFRKYTELKGKQKLKDKIYLLLKFIRNYQPHFPYPQQKEDLNKVISNILNYNFNAIFDEKNKTFRNNISSVGVNYLKSNFKSYWNSSFKGQKSPVEVWNDDNIMRKVIEYRIGLNNSGEVFDFSLYQLVRGLSARRYTISFFKPLLAAAIYKYFLGDKKNPIVFDPCSGFGGRMLGFKSVYPNGIYVGLEPNRMIYSELKKLGTNFSNIQLYNCKLEEFSFDTNYDLVFTSIPYFDKEVYTGEVFDYKDMDEWKKEFINSLLSLKNLLLNASVILEKIFDRPFEKYFISNNKAHFQFDQKSKIELLLKFF